MPRGEASGSDGREPEAAMTRRYWTRSCPARPARLGGAQGVVRRLPSSGKKDA